VLKHAYPDANIPVVQLSIDGTKPPAFHYETGKRLAPLRDEGVLVAGSGNVVHNLRLMKRGGGPAFDWAVRFNEKCARRLRPATAARSSSSKDWARTRASQCPLRSTTCPSLCRRAAEGGRADVLVVDGYEMGSLGMLTAGRGNARELAPVSRAASLAHNAANPSSGFSPCICSNSSRLSSDAVLLVRSSSA